MQTIEFSKNESGKIEKLTSHQLNGSRAWYKTNKSIPDSNGIKVNETILETYAGEYEVTQDFTFSIIKEKDKLYLKAGGEDNLEMFADTETKFFLKVNDAQFEFIKNESGKVTTVILNQGGRQAEAKKTK